jgi:hypothetical protein
MKTNLTGLYVAVSQPCMAGGGYAHFILVVSGPDKDGFYIMIDDGFHLQDRKDDHKIGGTYLASFLRQYEAVKIAEASEFINEVPQMCALKLNTTGEPIIIKRGEMGYYPGSRLGLYTDEDIAKFNKRYHADEFDVMAMEAGSMFGWSVPGADADRLRKENKNLARN